MLRQLVPAGDELRDRNPICGHLEAVVSAAVVAAALFAPAAGLAEHAASPPGGTGAVGLTGTSGNGSAIVGVKPANVTATVSGNGITITTD